MINQDQGKKSWADLKGQFKARGESCQGLYCAMAQLPKSKSGDDSNLPPLVRAEMIESLESLAIICPDLHLIPNCYGPLAINDEIVWELIFFGQSDFFDHFRRLAQEGANLLTSLPPSISSSLPKDYQQALVNGTEFNNWMILLFTLGFQNRIGSALRAQKTTITDPTWPPGGCWFHSLLLLDLFRSSVLAVDILTSTTTIK